MARPKTCWNCGASQHQKGKAGRPAKWPKIRKQGDGWLVDFRRTSEEKKARKYFSTIADAETFAESKRRERDSSEAAERHEEENRDVRLTVLTDAERMDVLKAHEILGNRGTLVAAVQFWLKHSAPATGPQTLRDMFDEYLAGKVKAQCRPATIDDIKARLGSFVLERAHEHVHAVTTADLEKWIDGRLGQSVENRDGYRRAFVAFFNYAVKRGYREGNPAAVIEVPKRDKGSRKVAILTPVEAERLLITARDHAPEMVPYFAIGLFCGLRPENELCFLDWRNIDFEHHTIHVEAATAKTRRERYVDLSPNLAEWLLPYRRDSGKIEFIKSKFDFVREKAGLIPPREFKGYETRKRGDGTPYQQRILGARKGDMIWQNDVMRHTFASYHLVAHNDAGKTAAQLGHGTNLEMLFQHYKRAVRPDQSAKFWSIRPAKSETVTPQQA